jgi:ABC-type transport system involved in multi-copper enzyme maturation permease subunit
MTAITTSRTRPGAGPAPRRKATLAGTLRSELTKLRSVRSTYWTLIVLMAAGIGFSIADCAGTAAHWSAQQHIDATQDSVGGMILLGELVIVVLGALTITSEYSTGMIRTSLTVMPRRGTLYAAKAVVFGAVILAVSLVTSFAAFFIGQSLLASTHQSATLGTPNALRAVLVTSLFVFLTGMMAYGIGAIIRHTAGAMTTAYALFLLLPQLAKALPNSWYAAVVRWLPGGDAVNSMTITMGQRTPNVWPAWGELAVFAGYAVVLLAAGALLFRKRDA